MLNIMKSIELYVIFEFNAPVVCISNVKIDNTSIFEGSAAAECSVSTDDYNSDSYDEDSSCKYILFSSLVSIELDVVDSDTVNVNVLDTERESNAIVESSTCSLYSIMEATNSGDNDSNLSTIDVIMIVAGALIAFGCCFACCGYIFIPIVEELRKSAYCGCLTPLFDAIVGCTGMLAVLLGGLLGIAVLAFILSLIAGPIILLVNIGAEIASGWITFAWVFTVIDGVIVVYFVFMICGLGGGNWG